MAKIAAMLKNEVRTSDPRCDNGTQCHNVHHALTIISRFKEYLHHHDLNLAGLAACPLCFPRDLPVVDSGKDTCAKAVVFRLQTIDEESLDALLTPMEGVPLLKLTSAKSVECDAKRRARSPLHLAEMIMKTTSQQRFQWVSVARPSRKQLLTCCCPRSMRHSQARRAHVVTHTLPKLFPKAFMFATCGTPKLVGYKEPITKLSMMMEAWKTLLHSSYVQLSKAPTENKKTSLKTSEKKPSKEQTSPMPVRLLVLASALRSCLLELPCRREVKAELNRFMVANTKTSSLPPDCA